MSDEFRKKTLIKEVKNKLEQLLRADLSEEKKVAVLKEILALTANEQRGGENKCQQ